jgi:hypothetical protein
MLERLHGLIQRLVLGGALGRSIIGKLAGREICITKLAPCMNILGIDIAFCVISIE